MSDVPPDLFPNILSRLPVKSLLRFRCVCNTWCHMIDDPAFVKLHIYRQSETGGHLIFGRFFTLSIDSIYNYSYSQATPTNDNVIKVDSRLETRTNNGVPLLPFISPHRVPTCNGLILIIIHMGKLMLWNPFIREAFLLPPDTYAQRYGFFKYKELERFEFIGLGYDFVSDDYKVVKIVKDRKQCWNTLVYSLKLNYWSILHDSLPFSYSFISYRPFDGPFMNGVFVNGSLHWIIEKDKIEAAILAFDLATEVYHLLPMAVPLAGDLPCDWEGEHCSVTPWRDAKLDALGECLFLTFSHNSLYRLDDYGGKNSSSSWTKLFSCKEIGVMRKDRRLIPISYLKTKGEVLLMDDETQKHYFLVNIENKSVKEIELHAAPAPYHYCWNMSQTCLASLVRLNNHHNTDEELTDLALLEQALLE